VGKQAHKSTLEPGKRTLLQLYTTPSHSAASSGTTVPPGCAGCWRNLGLPVAAVAEAMLLQIWACNLTETLLFSVVGSTLHI